MVLQLPDQVIKVERSGYDRDMVVKLLKQALAADDSSKIVLKSVSGGITNQLLKAQVDDETVLVRLYGKGTSTFIDREREYAVHLKLNELGFAPKLYCKFGNGLIYKYMEGKPAVYTDLSKPKVMKAVATKLGLWHKELKCADFDQSHNIFTLTRELIRLVPENALPLTTAQLHQEFDWFCKHFADAGGPLVMGHNDLLCGNILLPMNDDTPNYNVQFIDYEYSQPSPRGFDIANHFVEWQGYDCDTSKIPDPESQIAKDWVLHYLQATGSDKDIAVDTVVSEIKTWYGIPGFFWGCWAAYQSTISDIDFDYKKYACTRFSEYTKWKEERLALSDEKL